EYALEDPPLLGTQRTGPDLANVGVRQPSEVWNLMHLYNPRSVVPHSAMPAYPWYFEARPKAGPADIVVPARKPFVPEGTVIVAKPDAIAIVRYLQALKQVEVSK
ncbi:MAG: cbb3-type cytochrome c oxidase subunit II, partial [Gammaproteobacteria bacterium]